MRKLSFKVDQLATQVGFTVKCVHHSRFWTLKQSVDSCFFMLFCPDRAVFLFLFWNYSCYHGSYGNRVAWCTLRFAALLGCECGLAHHGANVKFQKVNVWAIQRTQSSPVCLFTHMLLHSLIFLCSTTYLIGVFLEPICAQF